MASNDLLKECLNASKESLTKIDPTQLWKISDTTLINKATTWQSGQRWNFKPVEKEGGKIEKEGGKIEKEGGKIEKEDGKIEKEGGKIEKEGGKIEKEGGKIEKEGGKIYIEKTLNDKVLATATDWQLTEEAFDKQNDRQKWKKGTEDEEGFFTLENVSSEKFLTATSKDGLVVEGNL